MKINLADESDMFACIVMSVACIKKMCLLARSQPFTKIYIYNQTTSMTKRNCNMQT
jgi:hypothetical protein